MRADRLVSLVLLLRQHGRLSATTLARELEVSTRTVLRDIDALSAAGVPVYAERGRHGGFTLLPGFRTELTGLNHDEALALLVAGSRRGAQAFGLGSALASAMRKVVDALPEGQRATAAGAARRLLIDPETDALARRLVTEELPDAVVTEVRRAVFAGRRLRIRYAAAGRDPEWRTVDPIGLVTVRDQGYLLATRAGADRTYRLSRVLAAEELAEPAQRPEGSIWTWRGRSAAGGSGPAVTRSPCWYGWTRHGGRTWWAARWPSSPREATRRAARRAGCGWRSPSRTRGTPNGRCGSSPRARRYWRRSGCATPCTTARRPSPPATPHRPRNPRRPRRTPLGRQGGTRQDISLSRNRRSVYPMVMSSGGGVTPGTTVP